MKKLFTAAVAVALAAIVLVGCGGKKDDPSTFAKGMDRKVVMGYSQIGAESEWRTACTESIKSAAADYNIELVFSDAQQKQENQLQAIRGYIQQKVDIIGFTPVVSTGWDAILQEAKDAGIPVICVDRATDNDSLYNCFIGSDFITEGHMAAQWLVDNYAKLKPNDTPPYNIVQLEGTTGADAANGRKQGFAEIMAQHPEFKIIKSQTGNFTRAEGQQVMEAWLKAPDAGDIDILYAQNDDMGIGAIEAIKAAGKKPGTDIIIVGTDAVKGAFDAMIAGDMNATVECNPLLGPPVMETAIKILKGEPVEKKVYSVDQTFDQSNAEAAYPSRKY